MGKLLTPIKLKNKYDHEIVCCKDITDVVNDKDYVFIKVYKESNPERVYLVNREAFNVV